MKLTIAIPCYNESGNIKRISSELLPQLSSLANGVEVLFIDDGSEDQTIQEILEIKDPSVRLVTHNQNKGLGEAVKTAIREAKNNLLIVLDADLTFHPREIPLLIEEYRRASASCIIGSHLMKGGRMHAIPLHRIILTRGVNFLYKIAFGRALSSYSSLFRLYDLSILRTCKLTRSGFDINAEILFNLIQQKQEIREVPVTLGTRTIGQSKIHTWQEIKNHIMLLMQVIVWRLKPLQHSLKSKL